MTVEQLEKELEMLEIPQELYSIMVGGLPNEKLCITKEDKWQVYYSAVSYTHLTLPTTPYV